MSAAVLACAWMTEEIPHLCLQECASVFSEYVKLLRQKFSTAPSLGDVIVPDTKQQLCER